ncbi:MAG TPA: hypothetical protein VFR33_08110 [Candidatus Dormibacteraeota bacterium]|nr:hypothetical protein [Candidatus Dormibacteraeota bacterium]
MNPAVESQRMPWSLWVAAAIAFVGGLMPFLLGGSSSRFVGAFIPFTVGAIGFAATALLHNQSRATLAIVYFLAGLAIVYGLMSMFSLPVRLAALGSCPIAPQPCQSGLPRVLSEGENNGMGAAAAFGMVSLFIGFFGLATVYRRRAPQPFTPPVRKIPPMPAAPTTPDMRANPQPAAVKTADIAAKPQAEEEELELPAPEELPELPAHESSTGTT